MATRLEQAVGNVVSNAIEYSPDGGEIPISVTCEEGMRGAWAQDHGIDPLLTTYRGSLTASSIPQPSLRRCSATSHAILCAGMTMHGAIVPPAIVNRPCLVSSHQTPSKGTRGERLWA